MAVNQYEAGSNYTLPGNEAELHRLNSQHEYLTKAVYEGKLVCDDSVHVVPGSRVLDSGTGTGAWILDLSKEVSDRVELHGSDVSPNNFPQTHPPNVHFHVASATSLPSEWSNSFDLVHQRLVMAGLLATEWPIALSEFLRVLKPGGHVQLVEMDLPIITNSGPACRRIQEINKKLFEMKGLMFDCAQQLPRMMDEAGFVDIVSEKRYAPTGSSWGKMGELGSYSSAGAIGNMREVFVDSGVVSSGEEFDVMFEGLKREHRELEGMQYVYRVVCARKPLYAPKICCIV